VEAETWNRSPGAVTSYYSAPSNTRCAPARPSTSIPTPTPKPYATELTVVRISPQPGLPNEVALGKYAIFAVEIRNTGERPADPVHLTLDIGGAISGSVSLPPGVFNCTGEGDRVSCQGTLQSIATPITASATFSVWVKGERTGAGTIRATLNDGRQLTESDYANNGRSLDVTVR
jgi:hypothetical protein